MIDDDKPPTLFEFLFGKVPDYSAARACYGDRFEDMKLADECGYDMDKIRERLKKEQSNDTTGTAARAP